MTRSVGYGWNASNQQWDLDGSLYRIPRPAYEYVNASTIRIKASSSNPRTFNIGKKFYQITSDLDLRVSNLATQTVYYLYAVIENEAVSLRHSTDPPEDGLAGMDYGNWTYLGAFKTEQASSDLPPFRAVRGEYISEDRDTVNHTGNTNLTAKSIVSPSTQIFSIGLLEYGGPNINQSGKVVGMQGSVAGYVFLRNSTANVVVQYSTVIPIATAGNFWISTSDAANTVYYGQYGWIEDLLRWP